MERPLQWRHNERDGVSNHQPHHCLLNRLFKRRSKKTSKLRVTGLCAGNSPVTGEFPAQMASNAGNVSIWWRLHDFRERCRGNGDIFTILKFHISNSTRWIDEKLKLVWICFQVISLCPSDAIWRHRSGSTWFNNGLWHQAITWPNGQCWPSPVTFVGGQFHNRYINQKLTINSPTFHSFICQYRCNYLTQSCLGFNITFSVEGTEFDKVLIRINTQWTWWRHQMETFSAFLALCEGTPPDLSTPAPMILT